MFLSTNSNIVVLELEQPSWDLHGLSTWVEILAQISTKLTIEFAKYYQSFEHEVTRIVNGRLQTL